MVAHVGSVAFAGIEVLDVDVQVQMGGGLPAFMVVGLPDKAVGESRERVRAAVHALGLALPPKRITVNQSPADLVKEGSHFDLPIALGVLAAMGALPADELDGYVALGELGLDGRLSAVSGVLPAAIHANSRERGLICPATQGRGGVGRGPRCAGAGRPAGADQPFQGHPAPGPAAAAAFRRSCALPGPRRHQGPETAKRAVEIAAAAGTTC